LSIIKSKLTGKKVIVEFGDDLYIQDLEKLL
jgi:hypothetical protein